MTSLPVLVAPPWFQGQMGVHGSDVGLGLRSAPQGVVYYVDSSHPDNSDDHDGHNPNHPLTTITEAITRCVTGRGDVIRVMPGSYSENLVISKDYVTLEGVLTGYGKPDIEGDAGIALTVHGQGFVARNLRFAADGARDAVRQQGNGFVYDNCVIDGDTANCLQLLPDLDDDSYTASEGVITNCLIRGGDKGIMFTNPGPGVEGGVGPTDVQIIGNRFYNQTTNAIDDTDTAGSNDTTFADCLIANNWFMEVGAAYVYILLTAGGNNSGLISGNWFADADVTNAQIVIPAGIIQAGNYDTAGFVVL